MTDQPKDPSNQDNNLKQDPALEDVGFSDSDSSPDIADQDPDNQPQLRPEGANKFLNFFKDPTRPVWQRAGAAAALFLFIAYPILAAPAKKSAPIMNSNLEESFPSGGSNLADSDPNADRMRALALATKERHEAMRASSQEEDERLARSLVKPSGKSSDETISSSTLNDTPFQDLKQLSANPVALAQHKSDIFIADRFKIIQLAEGNTESPRVRLDPGIYDGEFNSDLTPITSLLVTNAGDLWVGLLRGQLMNYDNRGWKILSRAGDQLKGQVYSISEFAGSIRIGSLGLWKWNDAIQRLVVTKTFESRSINCFSSGSLESLFAGGEGGIWKFSLENKSWSAFWKSSEKEGTAHVISSRADGTLVVGTGDGITTLSPKGIVVDRALPGERVVSLAIDQKNRIWAATRQHGLRYFDGQKWYKADSKQGLWNQLDSVLLDSRDMLWIGSSSQGLVNAKADDVAAWIAKYPDKEIDEEAPKIFSDLCDAAHSLLEGVTLSGGLTTETIDGRLLVFIDGSQRCPKGVGFRRTDGAILSKEGWQLTIFTGSNRSSIEIPKDIPADTITTALFDSQDRVWLGSTNGIFLYANEQWQIFGTEHGLGNNPISSLLEDPTGAIWAGSTPPYDKSNKSYTGDNLHAFNNGAWVHVNPRNGLAQWATLGMAILKSGSLLIGTSGGISILNTKGEISNFGSKEGMLHPYMHGLSLDNSGRIWTVHQYFGDGVTWFDGKAFHRVDTADGLFNNRLTGVAHDRRNRVWLIASNGGVGVYPQSFFEQKKTSIELPPRRHISLIDSGNRPSTTRASKPPPTEAASKTNAAEQTEEQP